MRFVTLSYSGDRVGAHYAPPYRVEWRDKGASATEEAGYHVFAVPVDPRTGYEPGLWVLFFCDPDGPVEDEETLKANLLMLAETGLWKELR